MKVSNNNCRYYVQNRLRFKGSNLYGETINDCYVVYSYGRHWPLFAFKDGIWYENYEKRSVSTSKQKTQCHPHYTTVMKSTKQLLDLIGN